MMDKFEIISALLDMPTVLSASGIHPERNGLYKCPFHKGGTEKHPSAKLYPDRLHCFTCSRSWDAISFTGELYGLKPIGAARKLSDDFNLNLFSDKPVTAAERRKAAEAIRQCKQDTARIGNFDKWEHWACRTITEYLRMLEKWKRDYAPKTLDEDLNERFCEALQNIEKWDYYFMSVFVEGNYAEKVQLYRDCKKDVVRIARRIDEIRKTETFG